MAYADLLRDPRWQRKRLEVMSRANFTCEECGDGTKTLHVHHPKYKKGRKPWEYGADELRCVCEDCHKRAHGLLPPIVKPPTPRVYTLEDGPMAGQTVTSEEAFPILWVYRLADGSLLRVCDSWRVMERDGVRSVSYFPRRGHPITGDYDRDASRAYHADWETKPYPTLLGMYGWEAAGKHEYAHETLSWHDPDILLLRLTDLWYSLDAIDFDEKAEIWCDPEAWWDAHPEGE